MLNQNYKEILINSINIFCKDINCSNCGGTYNFQTFTCEYCGSFNEELKESYINISSIIPYLNKDNIDKEITLNLYKLINSSDIFNHVLEQFDLTKDTKNIIKELETKVEYNDLDVKLLECIFSNDIFLNLDNGLRDIILRNVILRKNSLSKDLIEKVISHLVLSDTRKISKDSRFYIRNLGDNIGGLASHYYVYLDKEVMDNFYDKGDILIFYVLPHEMMHTYRTYLESQGRVSSIYDILALKERLLRKYNQDIYFKNYVKNLHEIEANVFSYRAGTNYLKSLGFEISEEAAEANFRDSAIRLLRAYFKTGAFENPYTDTAEAQALIDQYNQQQQKPTQSPGYYITLYNSVPLRTYTNIYAEARYLKKDTVVYVHSQEYDGSRNIWHLTTYDGVTGYVLNGQLRKLTEKEVENYLASGNPATPENPGGNPYNPNGASSYGYITANSVNFRTSPNGSRIKQLNKYAMAMILGTRQVNGVTWYNVNYNGQIGWIHGDYFHQMTLTEFNSFLSSSQYQQGLANNAVATATPKPSRLVLMARMAR